MAGKSKNVALGCIIVDNPYFSRAHADAGDTSNPERIDAVINIRESAITTLAARGQLDAAQVAAAGRFRRHFETMGGKGVSSVDPGRLVVDGGSRAISSLTRK